MSQSDLDFIHRYLPSPTGTVSPTLLLLHGTGGDENDLLDLGGEIAPNAGLLSPRGKVLEGGRVNRFFRRLAEGVFDEADLIARTHELADFVAAAAAEYGFDPASVIALGYSNGANIAASMLLLRPDMLAAAVLFHPMVPLTPDPLPALDGTPVWIAAGRFDPIATPDETERLRTLLRSAGADITVQWDEAAGHNLTQGQVDGAREWLASLTASE